MTDHDISELLDRLGERTHVSEPPTPVMLADAGRLRRRRTAWRASLAAASVAVVLGGVALTTAGGDDEGRGDVAPGTNSPSPSPSPTPVPEGMRLVGIGSVGIAVPEEWGTNRTRCGTPEHDTVVVDQGVVCGALFPRPENVESIELSEGRRFEFGEDGVEKTPFEQDGLTGERIATTCGRGGIWGAGTCRSLVYLPEHDVTFIAESSSEDSRAQVEAMVGWIQPLPEGLVAVPGTSSILYNRPTQEESGSLYGQLLERSGLAVSFVEEKRAAHIPDFIVGVEPTPGTVVPAGTQVTVTVIAEPEGPADEISVGISSSDADGDQGPVQLSDGEIKSDPGVRLTVGDHLWLYAQGARSNTLAGELDGDALVLSDWKEGPNYGRSWIADRPGTSTITVTIQVDGERFVLGTVTVNVR